MKVPCERICKCFYYFMITQYSTKIGTFKPTEIEVLIHAQLYAEQWSK